MPNQPGPMVCPTDGTTLVMSERSGIEIDYCPACRGVWLDRGELDKIIERAAADAAPAPAPQQAQAWPGNPQEPYGYGGHHGGRSYKRRKSFLNELFD